MTMNILITGGAGFIGSHIVDALVENKHRVSVIDDLSTGCRKNLNPKASFYKVDITDGKKVEEAFQKEKPEVVIHTAANSMLRRSLKEPILDAMSNIVGTINILEACRKNNVKRIIYTSTGGARVGEPEYHPVNESHPLNPCSPYGISKHTAEHYVWVYNKLYGLDYLIFCFGNVYGPRDNPSCNRIIPFFINLILKGIPPKIIGDGKQKRDFIYVDDLVKFFVENLDKKPKHRLFHLSKGKQYTINEIFILLKEISGFPREAEHIDVVKGEVKDIVLDCSLAKQELGWNPTIEIEEGLKKTFKWYKENKDYYNS